MTLALKPAIVFPPGRPAGEAGGQACAGGRKRRLLWLPPRRCEHTCLSVGRGEHARRPATTR